MPGTVSTVCGRPPPRGTATSRLAPCQVWRRTTASGPANVTAVAFGSSYTPIVAASATPAPNAHQSKARASGRHMLTTYPAPDPSILDA